jgi:hypothetical protein
VQELVVRGETDGLVGQVVRSGPEESGREGGLAELHVSCQHDATAVDHDPACVKEHQVLAVLDGAAVDPPQQQTDRARRVPRFVDDLAIEPGHPPPVGELLEPVQVLGVRRRWEITEHASEVAVDRGYRRLDAEAVTER